MSFAEFRTALDTFDVADYTRRVTAVGGRRVAADRRTVMQVTTLAAAAGRHRSRWNGLYNDRVGAVVDLANAFLDSQAFLLTHERPRYEAYAAVPLLRHVLGIDRPGPVGGHPVPRSRVWTVFREMLDALVETERQALSGSWHGEQFDPAVSDARVRALADLRERIPVEFRTPWASPSTSAFARTSVSFSSSSFPFPSSSSSASTPSSVSSASPSVSSALTAALAFATTSATAVADRPTLSLEQIAADRSGTLAIRHLMALPQSPFHDEISFLRLIQLSECLFHGSLAYVRRALAALWTGRPGRAAALIRTAAEFATPLVGVFHAVRVMPPAHFQAFRPATGDASAVQSVSWQALDAHVYGLHPDKLPVLSEIPEVRPILDLADPEFVPLMRAATQARPDLAEAVDLLDRSLRAWTTFHERQLAARQNPGCLPPTEGGTGGTKGQPYLARTLRKRRSD